MPDVGNISHNWSKITYDKVEIETHVIEQETKKDTSRATSETERHNVENEANKMINRAASR